MNVRCEGQAKAAAAGAAGQHAADVGRLAAALGVGTRADARRLATLAGGLQAGGHAGGRA